MVKREQSWIKTAIPMAEPQSTSEMYTKYALPIVIYQIRTKEAMQSKQPIGTLYVYRIAVVQ